MKLSDYGYPTPLRNLPGVGPLEWAVAQHGWTDELEEQAHDLAIYLFGIQESETHLAIEQDGRVWIGGVEVECGGKKDLERLGAQWEANFAPLKYFRDESDEFWSGIGWDVTDGEGKQLEVMRYIGRPMICFVKQLHADVSQTIGELEEDAGHDAEAWGSKLAEDARRFKGG